MFGIMRRKTEQMFARLDGGKRKKALKRLRGLDEPLSLFVPFRLGLFLGLSISMATTLLILVYVTEDFTSQQLFIRSAPVFRGFGLIAVHMWLWGIDVWLFETMRINHVFILKTKHRAYLKSQEVFAAAAWVTLFLLALCLAYFFVTSQEERFGVEHPGWFIFATFAGVIAFAVWPFDAFERAARVYIFTAMKHVVLAPFSRSVQFIDFFVADQLTSQNRMLYDLNYSVCFIVTGSFLQEDDYQCNGPNRRGKWILAFLPAFWRLMQCLRRYYDTRLVFPHLANGGKYFTAILVTLFAVLYSENRQYESLRIAWICFAVVGTLYAYAWDLRMDWGLLARGRKDGLRKNRTVVKQWYYLAMVANLALRATWIFSISPDLLGLTEQTGIFALGVLEVTRRCIWNFFRIENEHLNNCGQFRAVNIIPLPMASRDEHEGLEVSERSVARAISGFDPAALSPKIASRSESESPHKLALQQELSGSPSRSDMVTRTENLMMQPAAAPSSGSLVSGSLFSV